MSNYILHLHDGPGVTPVEEVVEAIDDQEAKSLAELRLMLSHSFTHVEVVKEGVELFRLERTVSPERRG